MIGFLSLLDFLGFTGFGGLLGLLGFLGFLGLLVFLGLLHADWLHTLASQYNLGRLRRSPSNSKTLFKPNNDTMSVLIDFSDKYFFNGFNHNKFVINKGFVKI